jgi:hypothetical protein
VPWLRDTFVDPDIGRHLLREEGEVIVDVVRKHWIVYVVPTVAGLLGLTCVAAALVSTLDVALLPLLIGIGLLVWSAWKAMAANLDCFVITNMRVFRVKGVLVRSLATMPLGRILDITVVKPLQGRMLGYGHFTFESAAQAQGLRDIHFVPRPDERDLTIQRVVQRSGLRGPKVVN